MKFYSTILFIIILFTIPAFAQIESEYPDSNSLDSLDVNRTSQVNSQETESLYPLSEERKAKLLAYSRFNNIWRFTDFFISLAILFLILFTGLSAKLKTFASKIKNKFFAVWLFAVLFFIVEYIISFPFNVYRNFLVEGEYGFVNQTFGGWFSEELISLLITLIVIIIPVWFVYSLINRTRYWWLQFAIGAIPFIILVMIIYPIFISPLFNEYTDLEDQHLKTEILALAEKAGIEGSDVFQVNASKQSTKINAYVTGVFNSKRIVLYDNLINNFTKNEIKFVMGHEMGHYIMNHIWIGLLIAIIFIGFALWLTGLSMPWFIEKYKHRFGFDSIKDYASLPLLIVYLSVISFFFEPVTNSLSRFHEHQSDVFGMDITDVTGEEAATAFDKLSVFNLSDPDPHPIIEFWFYSHPSLKKRMEFVRSYR